jgi:hypothetical protein
MELPLFAGALIRKGKEFFLFDSLLTHSAEGYLEIGVLGIGVIAARAPVPVAPVKLEDKLDPFVFNVPVHSVPIFSNKLGVAVECMPDLDSIVVEELLQHVLFLEEPCKNYFGLATGGLVRDPRDLDVAPCQCPFLKYLALGQVLERIDAVRSPAKLCCCLGVFFTYVHKHGTVRPASYQQHSHVLPTIFDQLIPVFP